MFDFVCPDGHSFEDLVPSDQTTAPCKCGKEGTRQIATPRLDWRNMGVSSDFPTFAAKWERMQREKAKIDNPNLSHY